MSPLPRETFARALCGLDRDAFAALVAELYAVYGWTTNVCGGTVIAERDGIDGTEVRRVRPLPARRFGRVSGDVDDADVVVAARDDERIRRSAADASAEYVSPADLREQLLYAIDRADGERLLRDHLGLSATVLAAGGDSADQILTVPRFIGDADIRFVALVALLVVAAAVVVEPSLLGASVGLALDQRSFTPAPTATPEPTPAGGYPPGVDARGLADVKALAAAHQKQVGEQSHTHWRQLDAPSSIDFPIVHSGKQSVTHRIAANGTIASEGFFDWNQSDESVGRFWAYDDGRRQYSRSAYYRTWTTKTPREIQYHQWSTQPPESLEQEFRTLLTYYLVTNESRVTVINEDPSVFRIVATGKPVALPNAVTNYTAKAMVGATGRVYRVAVTFDVRGTGKSGTLDFGVMAVGETTVSPPDWLDEAKEETTTTAADRS